MANHYHILGLPNFATSGEIQKAFRRLALKYHPDRYGGSKLHENKFKEINASYQILSDPLKKAKYDEILLYGHQTKSNTYQQANHYSPKKEKKEAPKYKVKKEPKLTFSAFQKVYMKVALLTFALFLICGIAANSLNKKQSPTALFSQYEQRLLNEIEEAIALDNLPLAIALKDSLQLLNINYGTQINYEQNILFIILNKGHKAYNRSNYPKALEEFLLFENLKNKYGFQLENNVRIRLIELYFLNNNKFLAQKRAQNLESIEIEKYDEAFYLAQILLENEEFELAFTTLNKYFPKFLYDMQGKYGAGYTNVLETGELHPSIIPALFQYVCLGDKLSSKNLEFYQDLLKNMIRTQEQKDLYSILYAEKFKSKRLYKNPLLNNQISYLKHLSLNDFFGI